MALDDSASLRPLRRPLARLFPLLLIALATLVLPSVAQAQATTPAVSSVSITSSPGADNTYATGDTITVSLTFSKAVTVTGTPHVVVDIGGQPRNFRYSGDGTSAAAQSFGYTVLVGDKDTDGVSLLVNSLTLNGGTIQATDDSTNATLTHAAMSFANHRVDTGVTGLPGRQAGSDPPPPSNCSRVIWVVQPCGHNRERRSRSWSSRDFWNSVCAFHL